MSHLPPTTCHLPPATGHSHPVVKSWTSEKLMYQQQQGQVLNFHNFTETLDTSLSQLCLASDFKRHQHGAGFKVIHVSGEKGNVGSATHLCSSPIDGTVVARHVVEDWPLSCLKPRQSQCFSGWGVQCHCLCFHWGRHHAWPNVWVGHHYWTWVVYCALMCSNDSG
jgi:hypothetical protein